MDSESREKKKVQPLCTCTLLKSRAVARGRASIRSFFIVIVRSSGLLLALPSLLLRGLWPGSDVDAAR